MWLIQDKRFTYLFVIVPREHEGSSLSFTYLFVIVPQGHEGSSLSFTYLFVIVPREHEGFSKIPHVPEERLQIGM
jgi:hypothetical protein